jgi:hypothetical protein
VKRSGKILAVVAVIIIALILCIGSYFYLVGQSKWNYSPGDFVTYRTTNSHGWNGSIQLTVLELSLSDVKVGMVICDNGTETDTGDYWIPKETDNVLDSRAFSVYDWYPKETIHTAVGDFFCRHIKGGPDDLNYEFWICNGVLVKESVTRTDHTWDITYELIDISPKFIGR